MNPWQVARQIKYLLTNHAWGTGSAEKVFRDVVVTAGVPPSVYDDGKIRPPFALIGVDSATADDRNPNLLSQSFALAIGVKVMRDATGEHALIGGGDTSTDRGKSVNRGLLEIEEEALGVVARVLPTSGVSVSLRLSSGVASGIIGDDLNIVQRTHLLTCVCPRARTYQPPQQLAKSGTTVSWKVPPDRFDRLEVIVNRVSGSTAPTSPTDGTVVYSGGLATSVTDSTSGTWTYAAWAGYDELNSTPTTSNRYSDAGSSIPGTTLEVS